MTKEELQKLADLFLSLISPSERERMHELSRVLNSLPFPTQSPPLASTNINHTNKSNQSVWEFIIARWREKEKHEELLRSQPELRLP